MMAVRRGKVMALSVVGNESCTKQSARRYAHLNALVHMGIIERVFLSCGHFTPAHWWCDTLSETIKRVSNGFSVCDLYTAIQLRAGDLSQIAILIALTPVVT
jgi:hypothetical protein